MKSIQTKIVVFILIIIMLCSGVVGGIGMVHLRKMSDQNSAQIMNLSCREEGKKLDHMFHSVEQSVRIISSNTIRDLDMDKTLQSETMRNMLLENLRPIVLAAANSTEGAVAVYVHFNPEIAPADFGLFYSKTTSNRQFHKQKVTDLAKLTEEEKAEANWYYAAVEAGTGVWLEPYNNGKIKETIVSYVVPIYQGDVCVGVAGMDVLFSDIEKAIDQINAYETGYAYLINAENEIIYHPSGITQLSMTDMNKWNEFHNHAKKAVDGSDIFEYREGGNEYKVACYELENGMSMLLTAPTRVIDAESNKLVRDLIISVLVIIVVSSIVSVFISQGIIRPLKELTVASKKIADGDLKITIPSGSQDEVGELAVSLQQTVDCLRVYMERMSDLAYTDPLTSVKSKTAYTEEVRRINNNIENGFHQFGVVMFDLNGLKEVNDTYGHDMGDLYIKNACRLICVTYKHSPVYRIGGDEFIAIITGQDLLNSEKLIHMFYQRMEDANRNAKVAAEKVSVAAGMAIFQEGTDVTYQSVFKRADEKMYQNKISIKSGKGPIFDIEKFNI